MFMENFTQLYIHTTEYIKRIILYMYIISDTSYLHQIVICKTT